MNFDFEEYLERQSVRPVPAHWRGEILRAARAQPAVPAWWREWLWPCPKAWAGLAAAWGIILLLNVASPDEPAPAGGQVASASWQNFAILRQETEIIAQLSGSEENHPVPAPPPAATQPRGSRRVKQSIG